MVAKAFGSKAETMQDFMPFTYELEEIEERKKAQYEESVEFFNSIKSS